MKFKKITVCVGELAPIEVNTYLEEKLSIQIDVPVYLDSRYILLTHAHYDHIADIEKTKNATIFIHERELDVLHNYNLHEFFTEDFTIPELNLQILKGDSGEIRLNGATIQWLHTPGHTAGSVCYFVENFIFTGDFVFAESIGRYDLPTSSYEDMLKSLEKFKKTVKNIKHPSNFIICPGHSSRIRLPLLLKLNPFILQSEP